MSSSPSSSVTRSRTRPITTKWSPASCTAWIEQSMCAMAPSSIGEPVRAAGVHFTSANLSVPRLAIVFDRSAWSAASRLTQKRPERWISGHAREVLAGTKSTSGGSSETLEKDWHVSPTGSSLLTAVTTVTPDPKRPSTSRKRRAAYTASGSSWTAMSSPGRNSKSISWSPSQEMISSGLGQVSRASGLIPSGISPLGSELMRSTLSLGSGGEVVTPVRDGRRLASDPPGVVDGEALGAELDVEPAGRLHVERDHLVVHVTTEGRRERRLVLAHPLECPAHVVELVDLQHDVHALGRVRHRQERQRVVPRVHAEEAQPHLRAGRLADELPRHAHRVAQPEAEHVGVEPQRLDVVGHRQHDVAHPLVAGHELR